MLQKLKSPVVAIEKGISSINNIKERWMKFAVSRFHNELTPNMLSASRIGLLIPIFGALLLNHYIIALFIYLVGCVLDLFDGPLARERNLVSELGKILDPLADKILFIFPLIYFTFFHEIVPIYLCAILVALETTVITLRILNYFLKLKKENSANMFGKVKMWLESIGICLIMLSPDNTSVSIVVNGFFWIAAVCAFISVTKHITHKSIKVA